MKRIKPIKQIIPLAPISVNIPEAKPKEAAKIPRKQSAASKYVLKFNFNSLPLVSSLSPFTH